MTKDEQLYKFVKEFIEEQEILCEESIYQTDRLQIAAPGFLHECCEIVGYCEYDEENDIVLLVKEEE